MKAGILLLLIPLALAAPRLDESRYRRVFLTSLTNIFDGDALKLTTQTMLDALGSDPTEQLCEQECHKVVTNPTLQHGCPLICHSFQDLVQHFHLTPDPVVGKRALLTGLTGLINTDALKADLQIMVNVLGSDPTEQACEQECHNLLGTGTLQHACPLICHGFQDLLHHFAITSTAGTAVGKRYVLDSLTGLLNTDALKADLQVMVNVLGSDPTEQACEQECHNLLGTGTLQHACPLICHGFQDLLHHFAITSTSGTVVGKRYVLDSLTGLLNTDALKADLQVMVNVLGSDPTEQACEQECHNLLGTGTLQHACPLICHGFQDLLHHFAITSTAGTAVGKRYVLDSLTGLLNTDALKADLQVMVNVLGSDPTEQACEQECHNLLGTGTLQHACPLICHGFQDLLHHFAITSTAGTVVGKRYVLDSLTGLLNTDALKADLQVMVNVLGSDPTEQACEQECHNLLGTGTLQHACPLICHGFQDLLKHFAISSTSGTVVGKRVLLDSFTGLINTATLKADLQVMVNVLGSDPTEQACEQECHTLLGAGVLTHACPLICHSFQDLINHFKITPTDGSAAVGK